MNDYISLWSVVSYYWPDILFAMLVSSASGAAAYLRRLHSYKPRLFNLYECIAHISSACIAGFVVIMIGADLTTSGKLPLSPWAIGALVPIAGGCAPMLLDMLNRKFINSAKISLGLDEDDNDKR